MTPRNALGRYAREGSWNLIWACSTVPECICTLLFERELVRCVDLARNLHNILDVFILDIFALVIFSIDIFIIVIFIYVGYDFVLVIFIFVMSLLSRHCCLSLRLL